MKKDLSNKEYLILTIFVLLWETYCLFLKDVCAELFKEIILDEIDKAIREKVLEESQLPTRQAGEFPSLRRYEIFKVLNVIKGLDPKLYKFLSEAFEKFRFGSTINKKPYIVYRAPTKKVSPVAGISFKNDVDFIAGVNYELNKKTKSGIDLFYDFGDKSVNIGYSIKF